MCVSDASSVRRILLAGLVIALVVVTTFAIGSAIGIEHWLTAWLRAPKPDLFFAVAVIALLCADVFLPVPASLVVLASGTTLGFATGALVSLIGLLSGSLVGYSFGRRFLAHSGGGSQNWTWWSLILVAVLRWIPVTAETSALLAGRERLPLAPFMVASLFGGLPFAVILAYSGHYVAGKML